jgi:hypothetical protein
VETLIAGKEQGTKEEERLQMQFLSQIFWGIESTRDPYKVPQQQEALRMSGLSSQLFGSRIIPDPLERTTHDFVKTIEEYKVKN